MVGQNATRRTRKKEAGSIETATGFQYTFANPSRQQNHMVLVASTHLKHMSKEEKFPQVSFQIEKIKTFKPPPIDLSALPFSRHSCAKKCLEPCTRRGSVLITSPPGALNRASQGCEATNLSPKWTGKRQKIIGFPSRSTILWEF